MSRFVAHLLDVDGEPLCGEHVQAWQCAIPEGCEELVKGVYRDHEKAKTILASDHLTEAQQFRAQRLLNSTEPDPSPRRGEHVHQCQGCMRLALRKEAA